MALNDQEQRIFRKYEALMLRSAEGSLHKVAFGLIEVLMPQAFHNALRLELHNSGKNDW